MSVRSLLRCPLDGLPLVLRNRQWRCDQGHSFDVARQGYVNLLPVQNKRSLDPGDSKEMVLARQAFLNEGWYEPIAKNIVSLLQGVLKSDAVVLDAGCGEGYYLDYLSQHIDQGLNCVGNDISKHAIIKACQRNRNHTWLVASNKNLPMQDDSVDVLMSLFGFPVHDEFRRVLREDGLLLLVDSGENHLRELRELVYPSLKEKNDSVVAKAESAGFELQSEERLQFPLSDLSQQQLQPLLLMTPHFFRAGAEGKVRAMQATSLDLTVDVHLRLFRKRAA